jgi:hypothetical protein
MKTIWSVIYKMRGDVDVSISTPRTKNLSLSSYVLFDTMQFLYELFFRNIQNEGDISGGKFIALFRGSPPSDSSVVKKHTKKGNHVTLYDTIP